MARADQWQLEKRSDRNDAPPHDVVGFLGVTTSFCVSCDRRENRLFGVRQLVLLFESTPAASELVRKILLPLLQTKLGAAGKGKCKPYTPISNLLLSTICSSTTAQVDQMAFRQFS